MLFEMNLSHVLSTVFQYCGGSQLCAIAQVKLYTYLRKFDPANPYMLLLIALNLTIILGEPVVESILGDEY